MKLVPELAGAETAAEGVVLAADVEAQANAVEIVADQVAADPVVVVENADTK